jgi:hypothetical protein
MQLTLTDQELDYVVRVLQARPYAEVASLIQNIGKQVQSAQTSEVLGNQVQRGGNSKSDHDANAH